MAKTPDKVFRSPDGTDWRIEVRSPGSSNACVVFHHPTGGRGNRYGWYLAQGPEARSVTGRLDPKRVLESITDRQLAMLFRRSMPVETTRTVYNTEINRSG